MTTASSTWIPSWAAKTSPTSASKADIPIAIFWLGAIEPSVVEAAAAEGRTLPSLHSSGFKPDAKPAIRTGVTGMTAVVLDLMAP